MTEAIQSSPFTTIRRQRDVDIYSGMGSDDVVEWMDFYERVSQHNGWNNDMKITNIVFYLSDVAKTWFTNHETEFDTWDTLKTRMLEIFGRPTARKILAERKLAMRIQMPDEGYTSYLEDVISLCARVNNRMTEPEKIQHILKGINEQAFNILLIRNPTTVSEIVAECQRVQECRNRRVAFGQQADSQTYGPTSTLGSLGYSFSLPDLESLIRRIIREELALRPLPPATTPVMTAHLQEAINQQVSSALAERLPSPPSYAAVAPCLPTESRYSGPCLSHSSPLPEPPFSSPAGGTAIYTSTQNRWRSSGGRPTCFYCGIYGHVMRNCHRRRQDQASPNRSPSPSRFAQREFRSSRRDARLQSPEPTPPFRQPSAPSRQRSPSPLRRSTSPMISSGDTGRSREGNW